MKLSIENLECLERKITITSDSSGIATLVKQKLFDLSKKAKLKGFRKGKVPFSIVRDMHEDSVKTKEVHNLMEELFSKALHSKKEEFRLAAVKSFSLNSLDDSEINFSVVFEVYPEITIPDLASLDIKRKKIVSSGEDFKFAESIILDKFSFFEKAISVCSDCSINVNCSPVEISKHKNISFVNHQIDLFNKSNDFIISEIQKVALGKKSGDKFNFTLNLPEDKRAEFKDLAEIELSLELLSVKIKKQPKLDETLLKKIGNYSCVDDFKKDVRMNLLSQANNYCLRDFKEQLTKSLLERFDFLVPKTLVNNHIKSVLERSKANKNKNLSKETLDILTKEAESFCKYSMIYYFCLDHFDIKISDSDVDKQINKLSLSYAQPDIFIKNTKKDENSLSQVKHSVLESKFLDKLTEFASIEYEEFPLKNLINHI